LTLGGKKVRSVPGGIEEKPGGSGEYVLAGLPRERNVWHARKSRKKKEPSRKRERNKTEDRLYQGGW